MNSLSGAIEALSKTERLVAPSGLTLGHVAVLQLLSSKEGLSNGAIGWRLSLPAPAVTRLMERLSAVGLVRGAVDLADLRRNLYRLEVQGHAVLFELKKSLGPHELCVALMLHEALGRASRAHGISLAGCRVLSACPSDESSVSVGSLVDASGLAQSTVSTALDVLVKRGLMCRREDSGRPDGRIRRYQPTEEGKQLRTAIDALLESIVNENKYAS